MSVLLRKHSRRKFITIMQVNKVKHIASRQWLVVRRLTAWGYLLWTQKLPVPNGPLLNWSFVSHVDLFVEKVVHHFLSLLFSVDFPLHSYSVLLVYPFTLFLFNSYEPPPLFLLVYIHTSKEGFLKSLLFPLPSMYTLLIFVCTFVYPFH